MPVLLHALASRVGSTLNMEELSRLVRTTSTSVRRYIQLLESLFLLYRLPSSSENIDKRLSKSPKIHFSDTALLLHVLNLTVEQLETIPNVLGHVAENFVVMECVKQASWNALLPTLFHYRQENGAEVDIVLEAEGKIVGIEVKLGSVIRSDDLNGLRALKNQSKKKFFKGIILYMGDQVLPLGEDFCALPLNALWEMGVSGH